MQSPEEQEAFLRWYQERKAEGLIMEWVVIVKRSVIDEGRREKVRPERMRTLIVGPEAIAFLPIHVKSLTKVLLVLSVLGGFLVMLAGAVAGRARVLDWPHWSWVISGGTGVALISVLLIVVTARLKGQVDHERRAQEPLSLFIPVSRVTAVEEAKGMFGAGSKRVVLRFADADGHPREMPLSFQSFRDATRACEALKSLLGARRSKTSAT